MEPERTLDGELYAELGGEWRRFRLTVPDLAKLQADTGVGAAVIVSELARALQVLEHGEKNGLSAVETFALGLGAWKVEYVSRTIFHALIRGGAAPNDAGRLVREWIDERSFMGVLENLPLAWRVITAGTVSPEDQAAGEPQGATTTASSTGAPHSRTAGSASTNSTAEPPRSAGAPPTSPRPRSGSSRPRSKAGARPTRRQTTTPS